jgi:RNA polymerase sigma-70 factor (ECF subfamily)
VTIVGRSNVPAAESAVAAGRTPAPADWVAALSTPGPQRDLAIDALHALLLRAARHQVARMRSQVPGGRDLLDDIATQAANDALLAVLAKLHSFEGRSRFTTWAYKFAVLQAATEVRRASWGNRDVPLEDPDALLAPGAAPESYAEAADFLDAVRAAIAAALTPHQRRVVLALLADEVPVDVLAERLGTNRNALYKTLHDARAALRAHLRAAGHLPDDRSAVLE